MSGGSLELEDDSLELDDDSLELDDGSLELEDDSLELEDDWLELEDDWLELVDGWLELDGGQAVGETLQSCAKAAVVAGTKLDAMPMMPPAPTVSMAASASLEMFSILVSFQHPSLRRYLVGEG